jgi:hypothetical protein
VFNWQAKGAALKATELPIDTSTAAGKAFLDMLGVFAEFETNLRKERQLEGIAKAKEAGVYKGRPASIDALAPPRSPRRSASAARPSTGRWRTKQLPFQALECVVGLIWAERHNVPRGQVVNVPAILPRQERGSAFTTCGPFIGRIIPMDGKVFSLTLRTWAFVIISNSGCGHLCTMRPNQYDF